MARTTASTAIRLFSPDLTGPKYKGNLGLVCT